MSRELEASGTGQSRQAMRPEPNAVGCGNCHETIVNGKAVSLAFDIADDPETAEAKLWANRCARWRAANTQAWGYMVRTAKTEAEHGRRFSFTWVAEQTRRKSFVDAAGEPFKINNNIIPMLARDLVREHPELKPYMLRLRKSRFDRLELQ